MAVVRINIWYSMLAYVISWDTPIHWTPAIYIFFFLFFKILFRPTDPVLWVHGDGKHKKNTATLMWLTMCLNIAG